MYIIFLILLVCNVSSIEASLTQMPQELIFNMLDYYIPKKQDLFFNRFSCIKLLIRKITIRNISNSELEISPINMLKELIIYNSPELKEIEIWDCPNLTHEKCLIDNKKTNIILKNDKK